jgi:hypothetical protein
MVSVPFHQARPHVASGWKGDGYEVQKVSRTVSGEGAIGIGESIKVKTESMKVKIESMKVKTECMKVKTECMKVKTESIKVKTESIHAFADTVHPLRRSKNECGRPFGRPSHSFDS